MITSTLVFEGNGRIGEYVGGYEDWRRQLRSAEESVASGEERRQTEHGNRDDRRRPPRAAGEASADGPIGSGGGARPSGVEAAPARRKLSFKERRELDALPARIEALEAEQARIGSEVAASDFYTRPASEIHAAMARLEALPGEIEAALHRWDELDSIVSGRG